MLKVSQAPIVEALRLALVEAMARLIWLSDSEELTSLSCEFSNPLTNRSYW